MKTVPSPIAFQRTYFFFFLKKESFMNMQHMQHDFMIYALSAQLLIKRQRDSMF